ncbi:MAG: hypothetical protein ACK58T_12205, partial [Phycisphaerae bacterium]
ADNCCGCGQQLRYQKSSAFGSCALAAGSHQVHHSTCLGHSWALFSGLQTMVATEPIAAETIQSSHSESETADAFAAEAFAPDSDVLSAELIDGGEFQHADQQEVLRSSGDPPVELPASILNTKFNLRTISWSLIFLTMAFCGAVVTLGVMVARYVRCLRMIRRCRTREWDVLLNERLRVLAVQVGIRRVPEIIVSDVRFGPAVFGVFRHTIVLPECLLTVRDTRDAEQVLATASDPSISKSRSCLPGSSLPTFF